jgi:hypothetical protein
MILAMIGTGRGSVAIAFVAIIVPSSVAIVVVMIVTGADPYATGTNVNLLGKCGCGENEERGGDCSQHVSTHASS